MKNCETEIERERERQTRGRTVLLSALLVAPPLFKCFARRSPMNAAVDIVAVVVVVAAAAFWQSKCDL